MTYLSFNEEYNVLTDEQGILIPLEVALDLIQKLGKHMKHSPLEMEAIGRRMLVKSHPGMVNQFNYDWFDYTPYSERKPKEPGEEPSDGGPG